MTEKQTILVHYVPFQLSWRRAKKGAVYALNLHGLEYPPELRQNPPRVRLLEDFHGGHTRCELLDPWPNAPRYWPPASEPGLPEPPPENFWHGYRWWSKAVGSDVQ
jgi:hypothetical protein